MHYILHLYKYLIVEVSRESVRILQKTKHLLVFSFHVQWEKLGKPEEQSLPVVHLSHSLYIILMLSLSDCTQTVCKSKAHLGGLMIWQHVAKGTHAFRILIQKG